MKKILVCFGTRPEAIKLAPVIYALRKRPADFECIVCSTGQHREMVDQALTPFGIKIDIQLDAMSRAGSLGKLSAALFADLETTISELKPDCVVVQGDTTSAMVAALVAFYQHSAIAHVEAGLRTYNKLSPFPEEVNRVFIGRIADFNFAPTPRAAENLRKELIPENQVFVTGNTVVDALIYLSAKLKTEKSISIDEKILRIFSQYKTILVTSHRRENFGEGLQDICYAILAILEAQPEAAVIFPVHLNPQVQEAVYKILGSHERICLLPPVDYLTMIYLMDACFCILSDSGGIQEEAPSLRKPLLVLRDNTERPEAVESGCAMLVGTNIDKITQSALRLFNDSNFYAQMSSGSNPFGDGMASEKIADILYKQLNA